MGCKLFVAFSIFSLLLLSGCAYLPDDNQPIGKTDKECSKEVPITSDFASKIHKVIDPIISNNFGNHTAVISENVESAQPDGIRLVYCLQDDITQQKIDSFNEQLLKNNKNLKLISDSVNIASAEYVYQGIFADESLNLNFNYYYTLVMPHKIEIIASPFMPLTN
ncbi:MAG: hypothetical protein COT15_03010 [Candidatus Diapherotrites archaeon CG08_land_8_20_14_0_20_34_12]|nr:MAG: hypothetical protein COT15_03010 [Candidatus Diapherotrites archaeon CG08_land_8_20_14_0_20_34_12]